MKIKSWTSIAAASVLLAGCWQKSVYPFYHEKDLISDAGLNGAWTETGKAPGEESTWTFTPDGDKAWRLSVHSGDTDYPFEAHLFKIGADSFLDLYSQHRSMSEIPAHHLIRAHRDGNALRLELLSLSWVRDWLKAHPESVAHLRVVDPDNPQDEEKMEMALTADVDALQRFVREHRQEKGFFEKPGELRKAL